MRRLRLGLSLLLAGLGAELLPATSAFAELAPPTDELAALLATVVRSPDAPEAYDAYAQAAFRARRWDEAIAQLKRGVGRLPDYHAGWYKLGYAYRQQRRFLEAAEAYLRYAVLEPTKSDTYFGLGAALQGAGDGPGAVSAYRRYLELEHAPEKQKFVEQARAELAKLELAAPAKSSPSPSPTPTLTPPRPLASPPSLPSPRITSPPRADAIALRATADKHRQAGRLDEAAAGFELALAADQGNLDLHVELGDVYFAQRRYVDAAKIFRAAVERDRSYALGWYNLAHAESRVADHAAAAAAYREYILLRPSDPDPYFGLGMACKALNEPKAAILAFRTYLSMEHRPEVQRWVDRARRELEALEAGGPHSRKSGDLKDPFGDRPAYASADDLLPPGGPQSRRDHDRIERELAADDILPVDLEGGGTSSSRVRDLKDPFAADLREPSGNPRRDRLARYAAALAAYRSVLDRQATEVALLYQRGAEHVLSNDLRGALRAWSGAAPVDRSLEEARARLDKAHEALLRP